MKNPSGQELLNCRGRKVSGVQPQDGAVTMCSTRMGAPSWQDCLCLIESGVTVQLFCFGLVLWYVLSLALKTRWHFCKQSRSEGGNTFVKLLPRLTCLSEIYLASLHAQAWWSSVMAQYDTGHMLSYSFEHTENTAVICMLALEPDFLCSLSSVQTYFCRLKISSSYRWNMYCREWSNTFYSTSWWR